MARLTKAEKTAQRALARERRRSAREELLAARMRTWGGFAIGYTGEKILVHMMPSLTPDADSPLNFVGGIVDLGIAGTGIYLSLTDEDELGDWATGFGLAGTTQLLDRVTDGIIGAIDKKKAEAGA